VDRRLRIDHRHRGGEHRFLGATLTRFLSAAGVQVTEVNRPNRLARRIDDKSDRLDA
jgi:hypothetical protein